MLRSNDTRPDAITWEDELAHESTSDLMKMSYDTQTAFSTRSGEILNYIETLSSDEINRQNASGLTALHFAAFSQNLFIIPALIDKGANVDAVDNFNWTPLHYTVLMGDRNVFTTRALLNFAKPNLEIADLDGKCPLDVAICHNAIESVELLIERNASLTRGPGQSTPLHYAARSEGLEIFKLILEKTQDINHFDANGCTPLQVAIVNKKLTYIKLLLEKGADANITATGSDNENTALQMAVISKDLDITKALLEHGANVNAVGDNDIRPLYLAIENNQTDMVKLLIVDGKAELTYVDTDKHSPLLAAVNMNINPLIVRLILENLPKEKKSLWVNIVDKFQKAPIHYACFFSNLDIIRLLLEHGANTMLLDKEKGSILLGAAKSGGAEKMALLLQHVKAELLNHKNNLGETALYLAVHSYHLDVARLLIEQGADLNIPTKDGETPLMKAAYLNKQKMVELLVNNGALVNPPTKNTPLRWAVVHENEQMVRFLLSNDATVSTEFLNSPSKNASIFKILSINEEAKKLVNHLRLNGVEVPPELEKAARVLGLDVLKPLKDQLDAREEAKALKKKMKKMAETVPLTPEEEAARLLAEAKRKEEEQKWLAEQRKQKEQEETDRKKKAADELEKKTRLEKNIKEISNDAYDFYAAHSDTAKLFTRRARTGIIDSMVRGQKEPNKDAISKAMLKELGIEKDKALTTLIKAYTDHSPQKTPAVEPPAAEPKMPQNATEEPVPETSNEDAERRRIMEQNKTLYRIEKEQAAAAKAQQQANAATSSSSSSSAPQIGMKSKEEANAVRQQVNALADLAEQYLPSSDHASKSLYEMKYDLIKMSALMDCISNAGAWLLIKALFADPDEIKVLRNGALHLIEINSERNGYTDDELMLFTCEFYRTILEKLSTLANLRIGLDKGLNTVLKNIQASDLFPLRIQDAFTEMSDSSLAQETYDLFEANHAAWKADPNVNMCSDAKTRIARCHAQITQLRNQEIILSNNDKAMRVIEIAELYRQGANAGVKFYPFPNELIAHKNEFTHNAKDIPPDVIKNVLSQGAGSSNSKACQYTQ